MLEEKAQKENPMATNDILAWCGDYDKETEKEYNKLLYEDVAADVSNGNYEACSASSYYLCRNIDKEILLDLFKAAKTSVD
jgi:hypothetical protein